MSTYSVAEDDKLNVITQFDAENARKMPAQNNWNFQQANAMDS